MNPSKRIRTRGRPGLCQQKYIMWDIVQHLLNCLAQTIDIPRECIECHECIECVIVRSATQKWWHILTKGAGFCMLLPA